MTRNNYNLITPVLMVLFIACAFGLSAIFPGLKPSFYLISAVCGGAVILGIDRLARKKVTEPITDERLQNISEHAVWISFRVSSAALIITGFVLIYGFADITELKFLGLGAVLSIAIQSLIYSITYPALQRRR